MYIYIFNEKGNTVNRHLKRIAAALLCCVITTSAAGCFEKDGKDGIIKYDIAYNPGSLDPQTASDDASILIINSVYTGLMRVLPDGSLGTGAAEDYTVTDDGLTYYELEITLEYPDPRFPELLAEAPAMPCNEEYFIASQGRYGLSGDTTPSNGAFYIKSWDFDPYTITDNNHLILRRNTKNSETSLVIPSGLNFFIEGDEDFVDDFNSSVISCIAVDEEQLELLSGKFTVQEYDAITVGLTLNTDFGLFSDQEFRKALASLVDREKLSDGNSHAAAYAIVPGEVTLLDKPYREFAGDKLTPDYSAEKSQEYYQNALPRLDMSLFSGARIIMRENETASAMLSAIMQEWQREFGFYCVVEELSEADFSARLSSGDYEIAVQELSGSVNSPGAYLQAFTTDGAGNYSGYHSADSDGLIKAAQRAADLADSAKLYARAEQSIINGAAFIPLYYKNEYFCINKDFADIYYDPFNKTVDFTNAKAY